MKKTLIAHLILGVLAGAAATGAYAGQIQASSTSIAREVIVADDQALNSPNIAYRFAGDVDARTQTQTFQVQFKLAQGIWARKPNVKAISVSDGVSGVIQDQNAAAPTTTDASYTIVAVDIDTDPTILWATVRVNQGATALIKQPIISINVSQNFVADANYSVLQAERGQVAGLKTVAGDLVADFNADGTCQAVKTLAVSFKHYVGLTSSAALATDANATPDEHTRGGATNKATLLTFPTNLLVQVNMAKNDVSLSPGGATTFVKADGLAFPAATSYAGNAALTSTIAVLGRVNIKQNSPDGYDVNLSNAYLLGGNPTPGVASRATSGPLNATPGTPLVTEGDVGKVEAKNLVVKVTSSQPFVKGGQIWLSNSNVTGTGTSGDPYIYGACTGGAVATTPIAGATATITDITTKEVVLTIPTTGLTAALGTAALGGYGAGENPVAICYTVPGNVTIPNGAFYAEATLVKAANGLTAPVYTNEQDNVCKGDLLALGGGIKIDVRNYNSSAEKSGYRSFVRLINNSDSYTADVYGQIIHQSGKFGGWGKLTTLAPRQILNMSADQIDALLTNAPDSAMENGKGGTTAPTSEEVGAPRLRITSNSGASLRVQNYVLTPAGDLFEASGSQGVDFEGATNRAPGSDGQYISQDANSGINGRN